MILLQKAHHAVEDVPDSCLRGGLLSGRPGKWHIGVGQCDPSGMNGLSVCGLCVVWPAHAPPCEEAPPSICEAVVVRLHVGHF